MAGRKEKKDKTGIARSSHAIAIQERIDRIAKELNENDNLTSVGPARVRGNNDSMPIRPVNPQMTNSKRSRHRKLQISPEEEKYLELAMERLKNQISIGNGRPISMNRTNPRITTTQRRPEYSPLYLTKRILISATRKAFSDAAEETMEVMGFNLIAEDGWLVKVYKDGRREKISKLKTVPRPPSGKFFD